MIVKGLMEVLVGILFICTLMTLVFKQFNQKSTHENQQEINRALNNRNNGFDLQNLITFASMFQMMNNMQNNQNMQDIQNMQQNMQENFQQQQYQLNNSAVDNNIYDLNTKYKSSKTKYFFLAGVIGTLLFYLFF